MRHTSLPLAITALAAVAQAENCFPYGDATLPTDLSAPDVALEDWWCPQSMAYGFQGFSYPLEVDDCGANENSFEQMDTDFAQMKADFGATIVRMYYPVCTEASVFENAVQAAVKNNMAVIFQVWTNFGQGDVWKDSQQAIFDILDDPKYAAVIPYVVHSADFGSEPVGDNMGGGGDAFVADLKVFRDHMNQYNISAGISEDWDRPGNMSNGDGDLGTGLGFVGQGVKDNSDYAHIHPMPFYHFDDPESEAWDYIQKETLWVKEQVGLPVMITETQWAWGQTEHNSGKSDVGVDQYTNFWKTIDDNCEWFKEQNVGWFFHAWRGEDTFDIVNPDGGYIIPDWKPRQC